MSVALRAVVSVVALACVLAVVSVPLDLLGG
jgi:hypothetical protein